MRTEDKLIALIPARGGSKRVPGKNIREIGGHPLLAYTIAAAKDSGLFKGVWVSTDDLDTMRIANRYGARIVERPCSMSRDMSPDIEWLTYTCKELGMEEGFFALLRPTSPFRTALTIRNAWSLYKMHPEANSLRAVEHVKQHPNKMWLKGDEFITPLCGNFMHEHDQPTQALPSCLVQNGCLQISRIEYLLEGNVTPDPVLPFFTQGYEGVDINTPFDWFYMEWLIANNKVNLPSMTRYL